MGKKIFEKYLPMTETAYYILLALREELHGYGIILSVEKVTDGRIRIGPGTIYGTLSKLENDKLIEVVREENRRKVYIHTNLGKELLKREIDRLEELYKQGMEWRNQYVRI